MNLETTARIHFDMQCPFAPTSVVQSVPSFLPVVQHKLQGNTEPAQGQYDGNNGQGIKDLQQDIPTHHHFLLNHHLGFPQGHPCYTSACHILLAVQWFFRNLFQTGLDLFHALVKQWSTGHWLPEAQRHQHPMMDRT